MHRFVLITLIVAASATASADAGLSVEDASVRAPDVSILTTEPVAPADMKDKSSGFGWRDDPINHNRKFHAGADIRGKRGVPVRAAGNGTVILAARQGGYGNVVYIDHGNGLITRYGHLQRIEVKKGDTVTGGQEIAKLGSTGRATGPHLHFEVRIENRPVNPNTALAVAEVQRQSPSDGRLMAATLAPEIQTKVESDVDPPRGSKTWKLQQAQEEARRQARKAKRREGRPAREGTVARVKPVS